MIKVVAEMFIKHEHIETVKPLYEELIAATRQEPLCIAYDLYIDKDDKGHFIFIEEWPDMKALDIHCKTEHFTRLFSEIQKYESVETKMTLMDKHFGK